MNKRWLIAAGASVALNGLMIALALYPSNSQVLTRMVDIVFTPGGSIAHSLGFKGGGEDITPMLAASILFYFVAFWVCLRAFAYVEDRSNIG